MKLSARLSKWGAVGALALATTASAQKEQWLDYHVSREGRGYRYLTLTTNPPPNVKLPKFNAQPYFAQWSTPMDPAGRWLLVANQDSDNLVMFQVDAQTGRLTPTGQVVQIGSPVCALFAAAK